jgi:predicted transcriptional regulator
MSSLGLVHEYRDRVYIRKDIILKLSEYGELSQSKLLSYCGLNTLKHKVILDDMVNKGVLSKSEEPHRNKTIIKYKVSEKGKELMKKILEPYELLFPRSDKNDLSINMPTLHLIQY